MSANAAARTRRTYGDMVAECLLDLREFIAAAERLVARGREAFDSDEALRLASEALMGRLSEAARRILNANDDFAATHPVLRLETMRGMRNVIAHQYGAVDYEIIWNVLASELPQIATHIDELLAGEPPGDNPQ